MIVSLSFSRALIKDGIPSTSDCQLMTGKWGGVWTTHQRGQVAGKVRLLRLICSGIWTGREVQRRQVKILPFQLFIKIRLRTESDYKSADDSMLRGLESGPNGVTKLASSGLDGRIVVWDLAGSGLEGRMGGMNIRH